MISESQVGGSTPRAAAYTYNANQRLASASVSRYEDSQLIEIGTAYRYNVSGIRTEAKQTSLSIDSVAQSTLSTRHFLIDAHNPTGYAQVLEETATLGGAPVKTYTLGDDVLSQTTASTTRYLLSDGHGSTRALTDDNDAITASHQFNHR